MLSRYRIVLLLGVALVLVWLNLGAPRGTEVVGAVQRSGAAAATATPTTPVLPQSVGNAMAAPWSRPPLEAMLRDPFAPEAPKPVAVAKPPPPAPPVPIAPPPPPQAPPLNLAFAGRMTAPDGKLVVYLTQGDSSFSISPGQNLPNGYRVDAITERAVEFSYPALNTTARLDLPAPQKYETR